MSHGSRHATASQGMLCDKKLCNCSYQHAPFVQVPVSRTTPSTPVSGTLPAAAGTGTSCNTALNARPEEVWLEVMTYGQFESFGESAALQEGVRGASIITNMYTELLVLTKHDLLSNISMAAREKLEESNKQRTPDEDLMRYICVSPPISTSTVIGTITVNVSCCSCQCKR